MNSPNPLALKLKAKWRHIAVMLLFYVLHKLNCDKRCLLFDDIFPHTNAIPYAQCRSHFTTWPLRRHVTADCRNFLPPLIIQSVNYKTISATYIVEHKT